MSIVSRVVTLKNCDTYKVHNISGVLRNVFSRGQPVTQLNNVIKWEIYANLGSSNRHEFFCKSCYEIGVFALLKLKTSLKILFLLILIT